jgi:CHASE3 domain sensor protein
MRLIYKRFSVIGGFAILLAVLVMNTAITRRQLAVQDSNQAWVEHTQRVQLELATVESSLKDAETGPPTPRMQFRPAEKSESPWRNWVMVWR